MSNFSLHIPTPTAEETPITEAHLLLLAFVSLAAVVWGAVLILGTPGVEFEQYLLLLGFFGLASALFVFSRIRRDHVGVFYFPVFLTLLIFLRFGLAPMICFLDAGSLSPEFGGHYGFLLRALEYVIVGMLAFWTGCHLALKRYPADGPQSSVPTLEPGQAGHFTLVWAAVIYGVVFALKAYMLHAHLYSYVGSRQAYFDNLAAMQVLQTATSVGGTAALAIVTIEKYMHPSDRSRRLIFWMILSSEVGWGLVSGMKGQALAPFIVVAVIASLIERRFRKGWVAAVLLGLVLLYPLSNTYRRMAIGHEGGLTSTSAVASTGLKAFTQTREEEGGMQGWIQNGWRMSVQRMELLTNVGLVLWLGPKARLLQGKERWWMVPFYPFIPRFVWHSKPILDKGGRFSVATGSTSTSSRAITYPGDLYADFGLPGIVLGMLLLGIVSQALANTVTGALAKRRLFVYVAMFMCVSHLETDAFNYLTSLIKNFAMISIVALLIYGPLPRATKESPARKRPAPTPCES